ncbi:DUF4156 domain-containing protein [Cupriavidus basilensis]|uniref:DUF4156 domain-containing protein n=1 Tax=Cupriavidus basilensis TaxID=68895 RepID=A0ABT6AXS0_9BURK|nr:DUF4156 domain-containing protein [Cupriavidus basilensis]MDF3837428.1 DUF4156 domain-containing protein [Cupriavidus basilensis]
MRIGVVTKAIAWLGAGCVLAACAPTQLASPAATAVRITHNEPGAGCTYLGDVTGSQGDLVRGAVTSNADLETGARNDLKNKAAAMGGNVVYLLTQRAGQTGGKDRLEQTNVTLSGNVYRCAAVASPGSRMPG